MATTLPGTETTEIDYPWYEDLWEGTKLAG